jgi:hypothetical protein
MARLATCSRPHAYTNRAEYKTTGPQHFNTSIVDMNIARLLPWSQLKVGDAGVNITAELPEECTCSLANGTL